MKKIALIYNLCKDRGNVEFEAEFDSPSTIEGIKKALSKKYQVQEIEAVRDFSWIEKLKEFNPDLIFNIAEGFVGPGRESVYTAIYEQLGFNYCGPDSINLSVCQNKHLTKKLLKDVVNVPSGFVVSELEDLKNYALTFPYILKLNSEGTSMGINENSVVTNSKELYTQCYYLLNKYKNKPIIVEEFLPGQDFGMSYVEGLGVLGPIKINYQNKTGVYDFNLKTFNEDQVNTVGTDEGREELAIMVRKIVKTLDIKGYTKFDFRKSNKDNKYYFIEANAQISLWPHGEVAIAAESNNVSYDDLVTHIVDNAFLKQEKVNSVGYKGEIMMSKNKTHQGEIKNGRETSF